MSARKLNDSLTNLENALLNLERALTLPTDQELVFEGTIHRFEIVAELIWKTLKRALEYEGQAPKTPRDTLKEAFQVGWLGNDEAAWIDVLDHRNMTSHVYLEHELVAQAYERIKELTPLIRTTFDVLRARYRPDAG